MFANLREIKIPERDNATKLWESHLIKTFTIGRTSPYHSIEKLILKIQICKALEN